MKLSMLFDDKIGVCGVCFCVLRFKVYMLIKYIVVNMFVVVKFEFDLCCWVRDEEKFYKS